ncbi:hypothetical protein, partial [Rhodococcus sp. CX]|uniref:hypothetical protein n=1 Tax=Rhodococcus sp. CX TaxID=2789880 RepID=UPI001E368F19
FYGAPATDDAPGTDSESIGDIGNSFSTQTFRTPSAPERQSARFPCPNGGIKRNNRKSLHKRCDVNHGNSRGRSFYMTTTRLGHSDSRPTSLMHPVPPAATSGTRLSRSDISCEFSSTYKLHVIFRSRESYS